MITLRQAAQQALEALRCVDLQSLVPDYGSGHYSVARLDGPQVKSAITAMEAALAEPNTEHSSAVEPVEPVAHKHEWFSTGAMKPGQMRCIHCGVWNHEIPPQRPAEPVEPVAWLRVIDEAMVTHHLGVADPTDDYETAKRKMNTLLSAAQDIGTYFAKQAEPVQEPCPNCASLQDQNTELDRKLAELEQTSLELCNACGWKTLIPGDCCLNCERKHPRKPLTDDEIHDCWQQRHKDKTTERRLITRAIERAHGIT